jgi:hypothetical protein
MLITFDIRKMAAGSDGYPTSPFPLLAENSARNSCLWSVDTSSFGTAGNGRRSRNVRDLRDKPLKMLWQRSRFLPFPTSRLIGNRDKRLLWPLMTSSGSSDRGVNRFSVEICQRRVSRGYAMSRRRSRNPMRARFHSKLRHWPAAVAIVLREIACEPTVP